MVGTTISHYKILEKLGQGGMGEVWKAEDTQLRRTVALKFLSSDTVGNDEVRARLIREAQAAAALDHPNICPVFGIHEDRGRTFIAMAYVDGPSLADKIAERPLPLDEALEIASQIAAGLQEAHEKGVVHRDVKPQNIMLTAKGQLKIMDFGLAALAGRSKLTKSGTTLGTPAYMAPEQLEGKEVDRRADIWALGVVLYEMLTQRTPFAADYEQAIAYGILNEQPEPVTALRSGLPRELDRIVSKALAKDSPERYQHADELVADIRRLSQVKAAPPPKTDAEADRLRRMLRYAIAAAAGCAALAAWAMASRFLGPEPPSERAVKRFTLARDSDILSATISPNGKHIAYAAEGKLWVQDLDQDEPRELADDVVEANRARPFWSPDSQKIGFNDGSTLRVTSVSGSAGSVLQHQVTTFGGGSWSPDSESIVFSAYDPVGKRLYESAADGGPAKLLFEFDSEQLTSLTSVQFLPTRDGNRIVLFGRDTPSRTEIVLRNLDTSEERVLGAGDRPAWSPSGHIVYQTSRYREGLWALPFSLESLRPIGEAFPVAANGSQPSVASDGSLVYLDSKQSEISQLVLRDRGGKKLRTIGEPQLAITAPRLSPDATRVAVYSTQSGNQDIWVHDVERKVIKRITFHPDNDRLPAWSPLGDSLVFTSFRSGAADLMVKSSDGSGETRRLFGEETGDFPTDWSRDGRHILFARYRPGERPDLWYLWRQGRDRFEAHPFVEEPLGQIGAALSPDGRFAAYRSEETGRWEIFVRPFPGPGPKQQVSEGGGEFPRWSRGGKELVYFANGDLFATPVRTDPDFAVAGPAEKLFRPPGGRQRFDVTSDGQQFVFVEPVESAGPAVVRIVQSWYEEFRGRE